MEIGGLHSPLLPLSNQVKKVLYTDYRELHQLRDQYPELDELDIVPLDFVSDANYPALGPQSLDFIIANHAVEHFEDFFRAMERFHDILRPNGILYLVVPDKRYTFDRHREIVTFEHLANEFRTGAEGNRVAHYYEAARASVAYYMPRSANHAAETEKMAQSLLARKYSIHYHAWRAPDFAEHILRMRRELGIDLWLVDLAVPNGTTEFIALLQRPPVEGGLKEVALNRIQAQDRANIIINEVKYRIGRSSLYRLTRSLRKAVGR
jgi:SAM-dependent methyltransferase